MGAPLGPLDYVVFISTFAVSLLIGLFFALVKKQRTSAQILVGDRDMALFPVCLSLLATYMSAILILGLAGEIYAHGTLIAEGIVSALIFIPLGGVLFLPTLYRLRLTSVYEYLELRFESRIIRQLATATFVVQTTLYTGIVLHAPALALQAIADIPEWVSVLLMGGCAGLYTSFGGIRAVVWSDAFQICMMVAGMLVVIIPGAERVGGIWQALAIAGENGRLEFLNWTVDPFLRHSTLNIFFGTSISWMAGYGVNQATVQRYCSMSTFRKAFFSVVVTGPLVAVTMGLGALSAIVVFANYADCDPLTLGLISRKDQISPYFVAEHLAGGAGLVGLYVSALLTGSLATVSSILNSLAAVVWEDFLKGRAPFMAMTGTGQGWAVKGIALVFTALTIGFGLIVGRLGGILTLTMAINGSVSGPMLGVFVLGIFVPFVNKKGAGAGLISGLLCTFCIALGSILMGNPPANLPFRTDGCLEEKSGFWNVTTIGEVDAVSIGYPKKLLTLSYMLYPLIGFSITMIVGVGVSVCTGTRNLTTENEIFSHPLVIKTIRKLGGGAKRRGLSESVHGNSELEIHELRPMGSPEK